MWANWISLSGLRWADNIGVRDKLGLSGTGIHLFGRRHNHANPDKSDSIGQDAWEDRIEAERTVERWLSEYPSTFITITGPPGSGKVSLVSRVLSKQEKWVLVLDIANIRPYIVVDCAEIAKAKNDSGLISALAEQTGKSAIRLCWDQVIGQSFHSYRPLTTSST